MRFVRNILGVVILSVAVASAQQKGEGADSVGQRSQERLYTLPEYIVSATRWRDNMLSLPSSATVLTSADLAGVNGNTLADAIQDVPGIFVKSYGGPGAVATTSMRGMGAEHTLVLVDGQRFNNIRDGQVDFGVFLLQNIDRVEILRGGYSSVYGADAVGGIINIITRRTGSSTGVKGEAGAGSYGMNEFQLSTEFTIGNVGLQVAGEREAGKGNYEFNFSDGTSSSLLRRQNSDYSLSQVQLLADAPLRPDLTLRFSSMYDWSDRGSPGAVLSVSSSNSARLNDKSFLTQGSLDWTIQPTLTFRLATMFNWQRRQYVDPLASGGADDQQTDFADRTITLTPHLRYVLNGISSVNVGGEYSHSDIVSNQVASAMRSQESIFVSSDHTLDFQRELLYQINLFPSVRYDHFSDVAGAIDPKLGINVGIWRNQGLRLRSSYGRSFRAPTFYDLYWKNGGNPTLRPEHSLSFDAGVMLSPVQLLPIELEANYFDIRTNDRIVWTPDKNGLWSPKNLQNVRSSGFEVIASWRPSYDHFVVRASYTNSDTRKTSPDSPDDQTVGKQLPYLPSEVASLSCALTLGRATVHLQHSFTGFRFATETNDPRFLLPGYNKTDASVVLRLTERPISSDIRLEISNMFNTDYQLLPNFPMPLRTVAVKASIAY